MPSPRDERLKDFRGLRDRLRRQPQNFASFIGELHTFLKELYEAAAVADGNTEGFAKALAHLCAERGIARWEDFVGEDQQRQFFKDGRDPLAQRIIAFWSELDGPLTFWPIQPGPTLLFDSLASGRASPPSRPDRPRQRR